jgi:hypothetical protein
MSFGLGASRTRGQARRGTVVMPMRLGQPVRRASSAGSFAETFTAASRASSDDHREAGVALVVAPEWRGPATAWPCEGERRQLCIIGRHSSAGVPALRPPHSRSVTS